MNIPAGGRHGTVRAGVLALALVGLLAGCARGGFPARPSPGTLPPGSPLRSATLPEGDAWLRHYLMTAQYDSALALLDAKALRPRDALQRLLQRGVVLHFAGRHAESNASFAQAERLADDRVTRSARQAVGSLILNDRVVDFRPAEVEVAMIPYYRLKNYLALADRESALVEARKAGLLLARLDVRGAEGCEGNPFLQYLSGVVHGAGGDPNDALVSLRLAERGFDRCAAARGLAAPPLLGADLVRAARRLGVADVADSAAARYGVGPGAPTDAAGDVVVIVEHGFAAHRMERSLHVPIFAAEIDSLQSADRGSVAAAAATVAARLAGNLLEQHYWGNAWDDHPLRQIGDALDGAHILRIAWPVYRLEASRPASVRLLVGDSAVATPVVEDVSVQLVDALRHDRTQILTRAVARSIVKYLAARELEQKAKKEGGEAAEYVVGLLANAAANALEQADTRGWSLLPDQISIARLSLPPGRYPVRLETLGADGAAATMLDLGEVDVRAGEAVFLSRRVWGAETTGPARWRRPASHPAAEAKIVAGP